MATIDDLVNDPAFNGLSSDEKRKVLSGVDPDFASLHPEEVDSVINALSPMRGMEAPKSIARKAWDALAVPEQMSRKGLGMMAEMVPKPEPTGNLPIDLLKGAPRIAADTLAEAAPSFVSRGAILTAGAAKAAGAFAPAAKTVLRAIGSQGEEMSGIAPKAKGALEAAYKDSSLMLSKGKKAAGALYDAGKAELDNGANLFKGMYKPEEILDAAKEYMGKGGKLEPAEALMARKAVDSLMKSGRYVKDELMAVRNALDGMAKASSNIEGADAVYKRGLNAEALRNVFPQNKYGGASGFKTALATALSQIPGGGVVTAPLFSPATQGVMATGAGIAARQALSPLASNAKLAAALGAILSRRNRNAEK